MDIQKEQNEMKCSEILAGYKFEHFYHHQHFTIDETIAWSSSDEEESVSSQRSKNRVLPAAQSDSTLRKGTQNRGHDVGDDTSPDLTIADHESSSEAWLCRKTPDASGDGQDTHSQVKQS